MNCGCIDGSSISGNRKPFLYRFVLDKPPGLKAISEPETIHFKKLIKSVPTIIKFCLEGDGRRVAGFNGEILTLKIEEEK